MTNGRMSGRLFYFLTFVSLSRPPCAFYSLGPLVCENASFITSLSSQFVGIINISNSVIHILPAYFVEYSCKLSTLRLTDGGKLQNSRQGGPAGCFSLSKSHPQEQPRRVPPSTDGGMNQISVISGDMCLGNDTSHARCIGFSVRN